MKKRIRNFIIILIVIIAMLFTSVLLKRHKICKELREVETGYDSIALSDEEKRFKDVPLTYIGKAQVNNSRAFDIFKMKEKPCFDGETLFTFSGYLFFEDEEMFDIYVKDEKWFALSDISFEIEYENGKLYVMSLGRELKWLQYNPDWTTQFGTVVNRAGFDWNENIDSSVVYIYQFSYDYEKYGHLAFMKEEY